MDIIKNVARYTSNNHRHIAYASTTFASTCMESVFSFYYVKIFLNRYHVSEGWFQISQTLFLIWNMLNDPLFAYLQDHCNTSFNRFRRHIILYGAPFYAISFLVPWFPWSTSTDQTWVTGLHLLFTLYFYDLMYTSVLLTHGCIHAEISTDSHDRIRRMQFSNAASLLGSFSVLTCELFSSGLTNYVNFQVMCVFIAVIAWLCMTYTGLHSHTKYELSAMEESQTADVCMDRSTDHSIFALTWQLLTSKNFLAFVLVNFLSEFHKSFLSNFTAIFGDALLPESSLSPSTRSFFYGLLMFTPRILVILGGPVLKNFGYYKLYKIMMFVKVIFGIIIYSIGFHPLLYMLFLLQDGILSGVCISFMGLALPDIIDEDAKLNKRNHPLSSMVFGTNALVTKPANSLAPMIVVHMLNRYGYEKYHQPGMELSTEESSQLTHLMFQLSCFMPVIVGLCQMLLWTRYTIRKSHINQVSEK